MITHSFSQTYNTPGDTQAQTISVSAEAEHNESVTIPESSTDKPILYALDYSQCKGIYICADAAMTLETNSSSAPDQTISLTANVPVVWVYGGTGSCPITTDITALYVTSSAGGTLTIKTLIDPTV